MSKKIKPASVAYINDNRNANIVTPRLSHFLFTLEKTCVSCNTQRNPSINEKALSIARRTLGQTIFSCVIQDKCLKPIPVNTKKEEHDEE